VTRDALAALPEPKPQGPNHSPIPHADLVKTIDAEIAARGYRQVGSTFALSKNGQKIFGVIDMVDVGGNDNGMDMAPALGFRASNDRTLALKIVAGGRVAVCDNLALMGDMIALHKMHTPSLNLPEAIHVAFGRFLQQWNHLAIHVGILGATNLPVNEARAIAFQVFADGVLPVHLLDDVNRSYFAPDGADVTAFGSTRWGLYNAFTRAMRTMSAARMFTATIALGAYFGMTAQPELPFETN
jgi:hypothetical protein